MTVRDSGLRSRYKWHSGFGYCPKPSANAEVPQKVPGLFCLIPAPTCTLGASTAGAATLPRLSLLSRISVRSSLGARVHALTALHVHKLTLAAGLCMVGVVVVHGFVGCDGGAFIFSSQHCLLLICPRCAGLALKSRGAQTPLAQPKAMASVLRSRRSPAEHGRTVWR
jgi:hypothetical protein